MTFDAGELQGAGVRVARLIKAVAEGPPEFSLKELAQRVELAPSTVHRLLQVLVQLEMVERAEGQNYRPGRELFRMASHTLRKLDAPRLARPYLRELWDRWQETATFCLYRPATRVAMVAESIASPHALQFVMEPFSAISLSWGSLGRAILANLPAPDIDTVLAEPDKGPISGRPLPSRPKLREELKQIRARGYALYADRSYLNVAGVAAAVFGPDGRVAGAVGVVMPESRFQPLDQEALAASVVEAARDLSAALGAPDQK